MSPPFAQRPLASLASYVNGYPFKPDSFSDSGVPVIRIKQLNDPAADLDRYPGTAPQRHHIAAGDLIFSWSGSLSVAIWDREPAYLNQHLFKVVPHAGIDKNWLRYAIDWSIEHFTSLMHGSAMTHITQPMMREVRVPTPPLAEQRRIADFLDDQVTRIDNTIAARTHEQDLVAELYSSKLGEFWHCLAAQHGTVRLGYLLARMEQGWSPDAEAREAEDAEWAVMRAGCINGGSFNEADHKALGPETEPRRQYEITAGDLLMSRASGSLDLIGSTAVVPDSVRPRLLLPDKIYRLVPSDTRAIAHFLASMIRSPAARHHIRLGVSGAEGMANNLPSALVRSIPLPAVPFSQQQTATKHWLKSEKDRDAAIRSMQTCAALLDQLKRSLVTAAVSGEFDVSSANGSRVPV